jgi:hypothetical protein
MYRNTMSAVDVGGAIGSVPQGFSASGRAPVTV